MSKTLLSTRILSGAGLVLALMLLFAVNILSGATLDAVRLDLTASRLFTLSEGTRNTLASLEEPVTLRLYLSQRLATRAPSIAGYATRVKGLLREYERASDGKVTVRVIDPEPFSEEEDRAVGYGLRGVPIDGGEETLYFGLVGTNSVGDEEVIPFLSTSREEFLEYDVTRLVYNLSDTETKTIGLISTLPIDGAGPRAALRGLSAPPWMVMEQIQELFEVQRLESEIREIPEEVEVLMLVHPKGLGETALYAIDQFVLRGGRLLVFVDPHSEVDPGQAAPGMQMMMPASRSSNLERLFSAWGFSLAPDAVVGNLELAARVRTQREARIITIDYPVWLNVGPEHMSEQDIVTADLGNLTFATAGILESAEDAQTKFSPLVRSGESSMRYEAQRFLDPSADPRDLLRDYAPEGESYVLAARVTGPVESAFPDGPPEPEPESGAAAESETGGGGTAAEDVRAAHLSASRDDINVIAVADTDMLHDRFWVQVQDFLGSRIAIPSAANGSFVVNALDNLTGSNALISVRNRGSFIRPFDRVNELREEAELRFREKEQQLITRLEDTEQRLLELEQAREGDDGLILSPEQQEELIRFRQERLQIRKDLRDVRRNLRESIASLESWLKFVNIGLVPLLIGIGGLIAGLWQLRRRRLAAEAHAG